MDNTDVAIPKWVSFTKEWHTKPYPDISPSRSDLSATGKNVVITGGGTGIGRAVAIAFGQAGASSVSILGRRLDRLKSSVIAISAAAQSNTKVLYRTADLTDRAQVEDALASITNAVGKVDIFVNNAGSLPPLKPVAKYDAATFMRAFEMNVMTSLNAIQAFLPVAGTDPILLNISSNLAHIAPMHGMPAYAASKGAQLKMVEYFAAENPELHVVSIQPGVIATEIAGPDSNVQGQDEVELPGHFCVWLASAEAKFLKGKFVWANWDVPELLRRKEEIRDSRLLTVGLAGVAIAETAYLEIDTLCHFHNFKAANPPATVSAAFPRLRTDMGEGRVQKSLGRRKACDLCCRRKIRCDAAVPKCSACVLHGTSCTWTPGLHVKAPTRKMQDAMSSQNRRFADIESRLAAVERSLRNSPVPQNTLVEGPSSPAPTVTSNWAGLTAAASPIEYSDHFALPPPDQVSALVNKYFSDYNQAMPLFYQPQFMRMLDNWYQCPHERNEASWASINAVLALTLQHAPSAATATDDQVSSECIRNAQSVLNHLVIRDEDLQGLQVVLALVILFLGTSRPQPSCVLIGTAVKLAHRLKLHLEDGLNDTNTELAAQKERLLWITYILDRDISMRTVEPYGLQDHDMEIDAISATLKGDCAGVLSLPDDPSRTANIFHLRIQLARIQGQMYDLTYSVRARKFSGDQQEAAVEKLTHLLEDWRNAIPKGFRIEDFSTCVSDNILSQLLPLYLAYFLCVFTTNRLQSRNSSWTERLVAFCDGIVHSDATVPPSISPLLAKSNMKLLPTNWPSIVQAARSCMELYQFVSRSRLSTLPIACSYQAALLILIANNLTVGEHLLDDHIEDDSQLIEEALIVFEKQAVETSDDFKQARVISTCRRLNDGSRLAISRFRQDQCSVPFAKGLYSLENILD